ncbi:hypothetical protein [Corynebacterium cystitidis]|uniref:hypothetical protein n=1 Tax=Corynebacterium cystitidis TaxID=35757 RepID=UPI00211F23F6|nr:hypothetical protein [Corynebacterium cystitidis]
MRYIPLATTATGILSGVLLSWFALSGDAPLNAVDYLAVLSLAFYLLLAGAGIGCAFNVSGVRVVSFLYSTFMALNVVGIGSFYIFTDPTTFNVFGFLA